jgi:hypothetical protein
VATLPTQQHLSIVATVAARNAIATAIRYEGMLAYCKSTQITYQLLPAPWFGTNADWMIFSALAPYSVPTFLGFALSGIGTTLVAGTAIAGSVTFLWTSTNPASVAANSISITDTTAAVVLASGLANTGTATLTLPSTVTHTAGQSNVWTIAGLDTKGNAFAATLTINWVASSDRTLYVRPDGNDANTGLADNAGGAFLTIQAAVTNIIAIGGPGDTVHVRPGTYVGFQLGYDVVGVPSGASGHPISFLADAGVTINHRNARTADGIDVEGCSYITIDGFTFGNDASITRAGIRVTAGGSGNRITNNTVNGMPRFGVITGFLTNFTVTGNTCNSTVGAGGQNTGHGIYSANAGDYGSIAGNTCTGNAGDGIHTNGDASQGGSGVQTNLVIERNFLAGNNTSYGGAAINCDGLVASRIQNNLIYGEDSAGITLYTIDGSAGSTSNVVTCNTVLLGAASVKHCLRLANGAINNTIFNNIFWHDGIGVAIACDPDSTAIVSDYNLAISRYSVDTGSTVLTLAQWRTATGQDPNTLVMASKASVFTSPGGNDYTLLTSGPAVNTGVTSLNGKAAPTVDIAGNGRPFASLDDCGCYESQTVSILIAAVVPVASSSVTPPSTVTFRFDRDVDPASIVFALNSLSVNVPGTVSYNAGTFTATFTPTTAPLPGGQVFIATISAAHAAVGGVTLVSPYSWSFDSIGPHRIWADSFTPTTVDSNDGTDITLGVLWKCDADGTSVGAHFYKAAANTGTHTAKMWSITGSLLATKAFSGETASGWQAVTFDTPVAITAGTRYWTSVHMPAGRYSDDAAGSANGYAAGIDRAPLHVNSGGSSFGSGFATGDAWPDANHSNVNYWVDARVNS